MSDLVPTASAWRGLFPAPRVALPLIAAVALAARLWALPGSTERTMEADSPHFMNVARCFERGQGFSNPAVWPAWIQPEKLPMPETIKEPAYPWLIAQLAPFAGGEFRAGVLISMLAGLLAPFAVYALATNLRLEYDVAVLAALLVAANPLAIEMSTRVMSDSLFVAALTLVFALAAIPPREGRGRPLLLDAITGACAGATFMVRSETMVALPALAALFLARRPWRAALPGALAAAAAAVVAASPFLLHNLRLFGTLLHSDAAPFGIYAYVDQLTFSHSLEHPPAPIPFALAHLPEVLRLTAQHVVVFAVRILPEKVAGNPVWIAPLVAGLVLGIARWRALLFAFLYVGVSLAFMFPITRDPRHFLSTVPLWALWTALGGVWLANAIAPARVAGAVRGRHLLVAILAIAIVAQVEFARREVAGFRPPECDAALAEAPYLRARLAPDEAAMVVTTSFYTWFADRPTVHLVIADERRFLDTARRLKVRLALLPTNQLAEFASRYPERRLPRALVFDHEDRALGVSVFTLRDPSAGVR